MNVPQITNVNAQCDKRVTELRWQRFASKVTNFQLNQLYLTYPASIWRLRWSESVWILSISSAPEN